MTELIYGIPGSGKSEQIYSRIVADLAAGHEVMLMVPDQEAVIAEEALAVRCENTPSFRLQVNGFSRLCNTVFRKYGGLSYNYINKSGSHLSVFLALCATSPQLALYGGTPPTDSALLSSLYSTIRELKRQGITPEMLDKASEEGLPSQLQKKLSDISFIYAAYDKIIRDNGDDPEDDLKKAYILLSQNDFFKGMRVYIDSFISFTPAQMKIIDCIVSGADTAVISLGAPLYDETSRRCAFLSPVYDTEKQLLSLCLRCGCGVVKTEAMYENSRSAERAALEAGLRGGAQYKAKCTETRLYACKNAFEEAEIVAADIRRRLINGELCRNIAVFVRSADNWRGILDAALEKYGIPYFISARSDAREKALFRLLLSALAVCAKDFKCENVITYIKTGLLNIPTDALDLFEDYAVRYAMRGKSFYDGEDWVGAPDGYGTQTDDEALRRLELINSAKHAVITPLYDLSVMLKNAKNATDISVALTQLLNDIDITHTLQRLREAAIARGDKAEAEEISQLWSVFKASTTQLCKLCGDIPMNASQYSALLETVLSQTDIGKIPTRVDEVTVGEASMLRVRGIKHAYVMGLNEGEFPAAVTSDGIFDDADRKLLSQAGTELAADTVKRSEREIYDFYRCVTCSSVSLTMTYHTSTLKGEEKRPSYVLRDVLAALPEISAQTPPDAFTTAPLIQTAFERYAAGQRESMPELYTVFENDNVYSHFLPLLDEPVTKTNDCLSPQTASSLMPYSLALTPSRLSSFAGCELAYCCNYILKLRNSEPVTFDNRQLGNFIHFILRRLIDDCIKDEEKLALRGDGLVKQISVYVAEYCRLALMINSLNEAPGKLRAALKRMSTAVAASSEDILCELANGSFRPLATEVSISDNGRGISPLRLKLPDGSYTYLTGVIDRVDTYEKDGITYIKLVDYKSGKVDFREEKLEALDGVQLILYMLTVCGSDGLSEHPVPAAMFYTETTPSVQEQTASGQEQSTELLKRGGIALCKEEVLNALEPGLTEKGSARLRVNAGCISFCTDEKLEEIFSQVSSAVKEAAVKIKRGEASVTEKKGKEAPCRYCPYISVCRYRDNLRY